MAIEWNHEAKDAAGVIGRPLEELVTPVMERVKSDVKSPDDIDSLEVTLSDEERAGFCFIITANYNTSIVKLMLTAMTGKNFDRPSKAAEELYNSPITGTQLVFLLMETQMLGNPFEAMMAARSEVED